MGEDSFSDSLSPGELKYYGFAIPRDLLGRRADLVLRVHVETGRLAAVYVARDRAFPNVRCCRRLCVRGVAMPTARRCANNRHA